MRRSPETARTLPRPLLLMALVLAASGASAQTVKLTPRLQTGLTWTDNVNTSDADARRDWIATVSPGLSLSRASGRFRGNLDASVRSLIHAREHDEDKTHLSFNGGGVFEALENSLFVSAQGSVSRNNSSAFGRRSSGDTLSARKDDENRVWSLSPYWIGHFGNSGEFRLSHEWRQLSGGNNRLGDMRERRWLLALEDPSAARLFGWGLNYRHLNTSYQSGRGRDVKEELARALVFVNLDAQFRLRFSAGYESNDYDVVRGEEGSLWGLGFDWSPTERTRFSVMGEDRFFGRGYDVSFSHRQARMNWQLGASRDISSSLEELLGGHVLDPVFQGFYALTDDSLSEAERLRLAREEYERSGGLGVRTNSYFLQQAVRGAWSLHGARNTLTLSADRSRRQRLNTLLNVAEGDDFTRFDNVLTRSWGLLFSHRVSGLSTLNMGVRQTRAEGRGEDREDRRNTTYQLGLSHRLSPNTNLGLSYRHQKTRGREDYRENAVSATLGMRF